MVSIDDLYEVVHEVFKEPIIKPLKSKMAEIRHLENRHDVIYFCRECCYFSTSPDWGCAYL